MCFYSIHNTTVATLPTCTCTSKYSITLYGRGNIFYTFHVLFHTTVFYEMSKQKQEYASSHLSTHSFILYKHLYSTFIKVFHLAIKILHLLDKNSSNCWSFDPTKNLHCLDSSKYTCIWSPSYNLTIIPCTGGCIETFSLSWMITS